MQKITPFLWFDDQAEEAANFYVSIFKNSKINDIVRHDGKVLTVSFQLDGQQFTALNGGPHFQFTEAVSFVVDCDTQAEVDYFWEKLTADGGSESQCTWLKDKYGLSWQIVPKALPQLLADPDPAKAQRVMGALMQMQKIDIEKLYQAASGGSKTVITVEAVVDAPIGKTWEMWTLPEHVVNWNHASDDWHTPHAENDLKPGGKFTYRMEARDGSFGFDFWGIYDQVTENQRIEITLGDERKMQVIFSEVAGGTHVIEVFEAEDTNPVELQKGGWQAILDNFKKYVEGK